MRRPALMLIAVLAAAGCLDSTGVKLDQINGGDGPQPTRVLLTDSPFPSGDVARVDVYIQSIAAAATADTTPGATWTVLAEPNARVNLLELRDGATMLLGQDTLSAGTYHAVRVIINTDSSRVTMNDGSTATVRWPVAGPLTLYALVLAPLAVPTGGTDVILDFDVGMTFLPVPGQTAQFIFSPFIRAVLAGTTGTVTGSVWAPQGGNDPAPLAGAQVMLWKSPCDSGVPCGVTAAILATTVTDSMGQFTFRYLTPGTYGMVVDPPAGTALVEGGSLPFTVVTGDTTEVMVTLPTVTPMLRIAGPTVVGPGQDVTLFAQVYGAATDSGVPQVTWVSRNPTIASVTPNGLYATIHGVALGSTMIIATSGALADSIPMVVSNDSLPPDTSQVAAVTVTPDSQTVAVGDSVIMTAHPTDSVGNALPGAPVTWAVSDSSRMTIVGVYQQSAVLRALGQGTVTVMATSGGKSGTARVKVQ